MKRGLIAGIVAVTLVACAGTRRGRQVEPSDFLAEYRSLMTVGREKHGEPNLTYVTPGVEWSRFDKILLEPVTVWPAAIADLSADEQHDLQQLVDSFYDLLRTKLDRDYEIVDVPGPGTLRAQAAITRGRQSMTSAAVASKIVPQARTANMLWIFATGKPAFAGEAIIEVKVTDAQTGALLAAGADRRVGGVKLLDAELINSWGDVKHSLDFWSDAAVYRLCRLRNGTSCTKPKA